MEAPREGRKAACPGLASVGAEGPEPLLTLCPIGRFHCDERHPYDAARQGVLADNTGEVRLHPGRGYDQALRDLEGFSHVWLVFWFDRNANWKPVVTPPRGKHRVGVFASRSPHRPNPIGLSVVRIERIEGLTLHVRGHDLLDGTPILDLKPYVPYADSVPDADPGWLREAEEESRWIVTFSEEARADLTWLVAHGLPTLEAFLERELSWRPSDASRKRVRPSQAPDQWEIAYRTWRADFEVAEPLRTVRVRRIRSGYAAEDLLPGQPDRYGDHALHRAFGTRHSTAMG